MARQLRGILSALSTPFTPDMRSIDEVALRTLVDGMIDAGIHGLITSGGTGEFVTLSTEERKQVAEIVMDQARGRVPVVPHAGSTSTAVAIELSQHAEKIGADGVMVMHPYCEPVSLDEVYGFYKDISDAIDIPIMVYNIPSCTGINLTPSFVAEMARNIKNVKYVKDSSGDLTQVSELLFNYGDVVTVFNGWDTLTFSGLALGSKGSVWGAPNAMPKQCADLFNLIDAGQLHEARDLWIKMWPVMHFFVNNGYNAAIKAGAVLSGFPVGDPRPPTRAISREKVDELRRLMVEAGTIGA